MTILIYATLCIGGALTSIDPDRVSRDVITGKVYLPLTLTLTITLTLTEPAISTNTILVSAELHPSPM